MNGNSFLAEGFIGATADADLHKITTNQTVLTVNAESFKIAGSATYGSNLGIKLELLTPSGTVVAASSAAGQSSGTLTSNISPGTYYIRVSGTGNGSPLVSVPSGFTSYASMGAYKLWGTAGSSNNSFAPVLGKRPLRVTLKATGAVPEPADWLAVTAPSEGELPYWK